MVSELFIFVYAAEGTSRRMKKKTTTEQHCDCGQLDKVGRNLEGSLRVVWQCLAIFGNFWHFLSIFGNFWKKIGNFWQFLATFGNFWQFLAFFVNFWHFLAIFGNFWQVLAIFFCKIYLLENSQFFTKFCIDDSK